MAVLVVQGLDDLWAEIAYGELTFRLPRSLVPAGVGVGDVIRVHIDLDEPATRQRRRQIERLASRTPPPPPAR